MASCLISVSLFHLVWMWKKFLSNGVRPVRCNYVYHVRKTVHVWKRLQVARTAQDWKFWMLIGNTAHSRECISRWCQGLKRWIQLIVQWLWMISRQGSCILKSDSSSLAVIPSAVVSHLGSVKALYAQQWVSYWLLRSTPYKVREPLVCSATTQTGIVACWTDPLLWHHNSLTITCCNIFCLIKHIKVK